MFRSVALPLWLVVGMAVVTTWAMLDRLLVPGVRWFIRQRTNRVLDELNTRLPIAIQPFQRTKRAVLIDRLVYDPLVQEAAGAHAREHNIPHAVVQAQVKRYAREIVPAFNAYVYFRIGYWLSRRVAQLLYRVRLAHADDAQLASIPRPATVVFVMNHRSNMDYVLVAYLAANRAALSYAVGEWARIWPLQSLIRSMGAYFVRRNSRNALYRRVLERYVCLATTGGVTQAIYPEGGLSRDGRLRAPKLGLLDYMLRCFDPSDERDLVFVPVGINYDRTLEDRTLLRDLEPDTKATGSSHAILTTLRFVLHNLSLMVRNQWHRFGYACVTFGTPISMHAYCAQHKLDFRQLPQEQRFPAVASLGQTLIDAVGAVIPVLPVSLVATVMLRQVDQPLSELELKVAVHTLIETLDAAGAHVYIPRKDRDYAITVGLRMLTLRRLVVVEDGLYIAQPAELPLLRYYANAIVHLLPQPNLIQS